MSEPLKLRAFSTPFKEAAVCRVEAGEAMLPLARELGVSRKLLYDWHKAWKAEGAAGLNRKRGPKPGPRPLKPAFDPAGSALQNGGPDPAHDWTRAQSRIAELERVIGRQEVDLDFFRKALRALNGPAAQGKAGSGSSRSSKP
jgi:transposase-like protein